MCLSFKTFLFFFSKSRRGQWGREEDICNKINLGRPVNVLINKQRLLRRLIDPNECFSLLICPQTEATYLHLICRATTSSIHSYPDVGYNNRSRDQHLFPFKFFYYIQVIIVGVFFL